MKFVFVFSNEMFKIRIYMHSYKGYIPILKVFLNQTGSKIYFNKKAVISFLKTDIFFKNANPN